MRKPYAIAERGFSLNKQTREKGIQAQCERGFSLNKKTREKGFRPSEILPLHSSSLLLKLERWGFL